MFVLGNLIVKCVLAVLLTASIALLIAISIFSGEDIFTEYYPREWEEDRKRDDEL